MFQDDPNAMPDVSRSINSNANETSDAIPENPLPELEAGTVSRRVDFWNNSPVSNTCSPFIEASIRC